jgi:hypothetical protein
MIAAPSDGSVSYAHAESLAETIPNAPSHMIRLGDDYPAIAATITSFLPGHSLTEEQRVRWSA